MATDFVLRWGLVCEKSLHLALIFRFGPCWTPNPERDIIFSQVKEWEEVVDDIV